MVTVEVGPGVDLPEAEPPRLLLRVEFQPDHVTQLRWAFRYRVGTGDLDVELYPYGEQPAYRDQDAEEALLAALPEGPWPAGSEGSRRRVAEQASLTGAATADFVTHWLDRLAAAGVLVETCLLYTSRPSTDWSPTACSSAPTVWARSRPNPGWRAGCTWRPSARTCAAADWRRRRG